MLVNAIDCVAIFDWIFLMWGPYLSFPSIYKPSTFNSALRKIWWALKSTLAFILNFLRLRVRFISSYFLGANNAPCIWAHFKHILCVLSNILQLASMLISYTIRWILSTNPPTCILSPELAHFSISDALKNKNRIGEIGDPCGILASTGKILVVLLPMVIEVDLSVRKLSVHLRMYSGTLLTLRLCNSQRCDIWSNALATSSDNKLATFFLL